jgi:hypothetical protein
MKRNVTSLSAATILPLRPEDPKPTIVRFPRPLANLPIERARHGVDALTLESRNTAIGQVRNRLLRMIVENERNRTNGNRAS